MASLVYVEFYETYGNRTIIRVAFVSRHTGKLPIHGDAGDKAALYRDRYQLLLQRIARDKFFSKPVFDTKMTESESCEVSYSFWNLD